MGERTYGERAVGLDFNPSGDARVTALKQAYARIIDMLEGERSRAETPSELARLYSIAITEAQGAQMWAVKAATWREGR